MNRCLDNTRPGDLLPAGGLSDQELGVLQELSEAHIQGGTSGPVARDVLAVARLALGAAIAAERRAAPVPVPDRLSTVLPPPARVGASRGSPPGRRRGWISVAVAAGIAAAAVAAPSFLPFGPGDRPVATADAATFLRQVAATAATVGPDARTATFWYSRSQYATGRPGQVHPTQTREIWIGRDRPGRLVDQGLGAQAGAGQVATAEATGGGGGVEPGADVKLGGDSVNPDRSIRLDVARFGPRAELAWVGLWTLPTDPRRLAAWLRAESRGQGTDPDAELFVAVGDLLRESPAPPALRAALYRVAAEVPDVRLVGTVTDAAGRRGIAVERGEGELLIRYVVDPADGRLLEEQQGSDAPGAGCGVEAASCFWRSTYLSQGPVATDSARL